MRRERGFTLLELTAYIAILCTISVFCGALALHAVKDRDLGAGYAQDVAATRRILDELETDLRSAEGVRVDAETLTVSSDTGDVVWHRHGADLLRGDRVRGRNIAAFTVSREDAGIAVSLELGRRSEGAAHTARVATLVHPRALREDVR